VRAAGEAEVVGAVVVVVVVVAAGELAVVAGDFAVAGEVFAAAAGEVFAVAGEVGAFGEVWAKANPAGRAARRAIARIERMGFMEWSFLF
jgi:phage baseplate assembly protein gpV